MNPLTEEIIAETRRHYNAGRAESSKRYFREHIEAWGLPIPLCKEIAATWTVTIDGTRELYRRLTEMQLVKV